MNPNSDVNILGSLPPLPPDLIGKDNESPPPYVETTGVGTASPTPAEVDVGYEILFHSPHGADNIAPIDVALYFLAIGSGAYGVEFRKYAREWPVRANPVIHHFFSATSTKPDGDQTAWCAAFVNWCILRANAKTADEIGISPRPQFSKVGRAFAPENLARLSTGSASSGSFRCWPEVRSPKRGAIAVFKDVGTDNLTSVCRGTGHVAFVLENPSAAGQGWVRCVGGNQFEKESGGAVTIADWKTTPGSRFMKFVQTKQV